MVTVTQGQYSNITCQYGKYQSKRLLIKFEDTALAQSTESIIFSQSYKPGDISDVFYITKYILVLNCVTNCLKCEDKYNCNQCYPTFQKLTVNGYQVCEQVSDCQILNCFSCAQTHSKSEQCIRCMPGYNLVSNACVKIISALPCTSKQYVQEDQSCSEFSKKCFFYDEDYNTYKPCYYEDFSVYKCKIDTIIVIFNYMLGDIYNCVSSAQMVNNCSTFTFYQSCDQCEQGYQYNSEQNNCIQSNCPDGQYKDTTEGTCKHCGDNCQLCNQESCTKCLSNSYIIDQAQPRSCKLCNIPNCSLCDIDGSCNTCNTNYFRDDTHMSCVKCQVLNCNKCHNDGPYFCEVCLQNYLFHAETRECICQVKNCNKCQEQDGQKCTLCAENYKVNTSTQQCELKCIVPNCQLCDSIDNNKCIVCNDNNKLNPQSQCEQKCIVNHCQQCNIQDNKLCIQCNDNYKLNVQSQCEAICSVANCQQCDSDDSSKCLLCKDTYKLNAQSQCELKCNVLNCQYCEDSNSSICQKCQPNYILNQNNSSCGVCLVKNCKECVSNNQTQCKTCQSDYLKDRTLSKCSQFKITEANNPKFIQQVNSDGYIINVEFKKELILDKNDLTQEFNIYITNVNTTNISTTLLENKKGFNIDIQISQNSKEQQLVIEVKDEYFQKENSLEEKEYRVQLQTYVVVSQQQKEAAAQAGQINKKVSQGFLMTLIPLIIFGNYYILINTIDITSFIYYLLYVNVRYPQNVLQFCSQFKNFQFPFIPNIFLYFIDPNYVVVSPKKFMENEADCYFMKNGGQGITICIGVILIYLIVKVFSLYMPWLRLKNYLLRKIDETWEYSAFFEMVGTSYIYILVGVFLQFYDFDGSDPMKSSYINFSLFTFSLIFVTIYPIYLIKLIRQTKNIKSNKYFQKKFNSIIGGLKLYDDGAVKEHKKRAQREINFQNYLQVLEFKRKLFEIQLSGYCTGIGYIRKYLFCLVIVYLHDYPPIQLMLFIFLSMSMMFYYFYVRPYENAFDNIKNGLCELFLIGFEFCLLYLLDDQSEQLEQIRINVGWGIVALCSLMIGVHAITMVIEIMKLIYLFFTKFVFAICIHQYSKIHKSQIYRTKTRGIGSGVSVVQSNQIPDLGSNLFSDKNLNGQEDNKIHTKIHSYRDSGKIRFETSPYDSPQLQNNQSSNQYKKSQQNLKDDIISKNYSEIKGTVMSPSEAPEVSTFFKSRKFLANNYSSSNYYENSLFSSIHQDKMDTLRVPELKSDFFKNQGSNFIELNKRKSSSSSSSSQKN